MCEIQKEHGRTHTRVDERQRAVGKFTRMLYHT